mmetsp:Transcript_27057/g.23954  ORF Transcript_27057/g.23954 Transcript_27057/m.23954 type:complete len:157 (-) Transcript_27057:33-503(-)
MEVAQNLIKSYELMLGFFGMKLANPKTGALERAKNYEERYYETLITSLHNHMRVRRILAHLNVVGFRKYAIELVYFLEEEMFGHKGAYLKYIRENPLKPETLKSLKMNPLFRVVKHNVFKDWRKYGETKSDHDVKELHKNCFTDDPRDYQDSVYFK